MPPNAQFTRPRQLQYLRTTATVLLRVGCNAGFGGLCRFRLLPLAQDGGFPLSEGLSPRAQVGCALESLLGDDRRLIPVECLDCGSQLLQRLPNARLQVFAGAGHQFHSEEFATVLPVVLDFVERIEANRHASSPAPG